MVAWSNGKEVASIWRETKPQVHRFTNIGVGSKTAIKDEVASTKGVSKPYISGCGSTASRGAVEAVGNKVLSTFADSTVNSKTVSQGDSCKFYVV